MVNGMPITPQIRWANQRMAFGKPLSAQAVVRNRIASMISRVEACQAWLESVTHQMNNVYKCFMILLYS